MPRKSTIPAYKLHAATGQARVIIDGKHIYLGKFNSPESKAQYELLVRKLLTNRTDVEMRERVQVSNDLRVIELVRDYLKFARGYYVKNGVPTPEYPQIYAALTPVREQYGEELVTSLGPLKIKAIREAWIKDGIVRGQINKRIGRIRRMVAWGVEEEKVPPSVLQALKAIKGLKRGRTDAREGKKVLPVPEAWVDAVKPFVSRQIWAMVELQRYTGMRPTEVCVMRTIDINTSGKLWEYRPIENKMEHQDRQRIVQLGPRAQRVLSAWLRTDVESFLFCPREAMEERWAQARATRKTPVQPSQRSRKKALPKRTPGDRYTYRSYSRAIREACVEAGVPHWAPNQLRHLVGTRVRREMGLEASQCVLGHARADVTQVYAERDAELARAAMERFG
jgi:integrase